MFVHLLLLIPLTFDANDYEGLAMLKLVSLGSQLARSLRRLRL